MWRGSQSAHSSGGELTLKKRCVLPKAKLLHERQELVLRGNSSKTFHYLVTRDQKVEKLNTGTRVLFYLDTEINIFYLPFLRSIKRKIFPIVKKSVKLLDIIFFIC